MTTTKTKSPTLNYRAAIEKLHPASTQEDLHNAICATLKANLTPIEIDIAQALIKKKKGVSIGAVRKEFERLRSRITNVENEEAGKFKLPDELRYFNLPPDYMGTFCVVKAGGRWWVAQVVGDKTIRRFTLLQVEYGITFRDRRNAKGLRVELQTSEGEWVTVDIDAGLLAQLNGNDIIEMLLRAGMSLSYGGRECLLRMLAESATGGNVIYHRPGFRDEKVYLLPNGAQVPPFTPVELSSDSIAAVGDLAGSFTGWKAGCDALFALPHAIPQQIAVIAGLAGILANIIGDPPLVFFIAGVTSSMKSTAQKLAVAHFCEPRLGPNGLFVRAHGTKNSLEAPLERSSGSVLALDEVSKMPADELTEFLYMIEGRNAKMRLNQRGSLRTGQSWTGCSVMMSGESSLGQRLLEEGVTQHGGLSVRVLMIRTSEQTRLSDEDFKNVSAMLDNYGWSGEVFVEGLLRWGFLADPQQIADRVRWLVETIPGTSGSNSVQIRRTARMVGFLFVAAQLACDFGILPRYFDVEKLILAYWKQVLASDIAPADPAQKAVATLFDWIIANKGSELRDFNDPDKGNRSAIGWFGATLDGKLDSETYYVIRSDKLTDIAGRAADKGALLKALEKSGALVLSKKNERTWSGFPGLGKNSQYVVLRASQIDGV